MNPSNPLSELFDARLPAGLGGRWYGVFPALVTDIKDPDGQGRVKISLPWSPDAQGAACELWARLATLMSCCTPLSHSEAANLPLLVLPPPRLRLLNPVQAVQAGLTLCFARPNRVPKVDGNASRRACTRATLRIMVAFLPFQRDLPVSYSASFTSS